MTSGALFVAVLLACIVEAVEAVTIVLAAGTSRNWRSTMAGVYSALAVLVCVVAALGPALRILPLGALRLVVGGLLLIFGLQWIRKAILRASGYKSLHDEDEIYRTTAAAASAATGAGASGWVTGTRSPWRSRGCCSRASRLRSSC